MAPGDDCATAAMSISSSSPKSPFSSTKYRRIIGSTTYPPPNEKLLTSTSVLNSHDKSFTFSQVIIFSFALIIAVVYL
jgi:hypothetical protein